MTGSYFSINFVSFWEVLTVELTVIIVVRDFLVYSKRLFNIQENYMEVTVKLTKPT